MHHGQCRTDIIMQLRDCLRKLSARDNGMENLHGKNSAFAKRMQALWRSGQFCDMILMSGQAGVSCHRCVIGASSHPLLLLLEAAQAELQQDVGHTCVIQLEDRYSDKALLIVVEYMYDEIGCPNLGEVELMCLVDVCRLASICGLFHVAGLGAEALGGFLQDLDIQSLKHILCKMQLVEPTHPKYAKVGWAHISSPPRSDGPAII